MNEFSNEQFNEIITEMMVKKLDLKEILEMSLKGMMKLERKIFLEDSNVKNKGSGYRGIHASFEDTTLKLSVPRNRKEIFLRLKDKISITFKILTPFFSRNSHKIYIIGHKVYQFL